MTQRRRPNRSLDSMPYGRCARRSASRAAGCAGQSGLGFVRKQALRSEVPAVVGVVSHLVTLHHRLQPFAVVGVTRGDADEKGQSEAERLAGAERWARRGYWDELRMQAAARAVVGRDTEAQARAIADDLRLGIDTPQHDMDTVDRDAAVRAATLQALSDRGTLRCASSAGTGRPRGRPAASCAS